MKNFLQPFHILQPVKIKPFSVERSSKVPKRNQGKPQKIMNKYLFSNLAIVTEYM